METTPSVSASNSKPGYQTCNEIPTQCDKLTHGPLACKSYAPARASGGRYAWFCKTDQGLGGNDLDT